MDPVIVISVAAETNAGKLSHMEDYIAISLCPNDDLKEIPELCEQAFVGVFDGHGGKEAAKFSREQMWETIQRQPKFRSTEVESVQEAIKDAFLSLHNEMASHRCKYDVISPIIIYMPLISVCSNCEFLMVSVVGGKWRIFCLVNLSPPLPPHVSTLQLHGSGIRLVTSVLLGQLLA